jgi:alanine-glyoxylate transaminase/serine-glyoxylate transaminase/serine-pyruvate transaminase
MKTGHTHLFIPGPTNVPDEVRRAMNVGQEDMRAPDFGDLTLGLFSDLKRVMRTATGEVFIFPGSGTAAWEAAITNTLNPGDKVLMARFGQFSTLWVEMAERLGLDVEVIDVAWGAGVPVAEFERRLGADTKDEIKAVFVTHNETATGVTSDVAACAARSTRVSTTRCSSSMASAPSRRSTSAWMTGASTSPSPAARRA